MNESQLLAETAFSLAKALKIDKIIVRADNERHIRLLERLRGSERIVWVTRDSGSVPGMDPHRDVVVPLPDADLTPRSRLNLALFLAVLNGHVELDERLLTISEEESHRLEMLHITTAGRHLPKFQKHEIQFVATRDLARTIRIALRFSAEGREGHSIGTTFVIGELEEMAPYLRQLVLNPF
ncbi:MAG: hypothetical protein GY953_28355, partial [bacterium]|nr:hypothetical protein [bacterium]